METRIEYGPAFAQATLVLQAGESVMSEAGAMVAMSPNLEIETSASGGGGFGGVMKSLKRAVGGESFFMNTYVAQQGAGYLTVAPELPGDVVHRPLGQETIYLTSGNYLASSSSVDVDTSWGGAKTFFSGEGLVLLKISGPGDLLMATYGAIQEVPLQPGQVHIVDTGHVVGFTEGVGYEVRKFGGWKSTVLGGEGLVVNLTGPGTAWVQTRSPRALLDWIIPKLPKDNS